MSTKSSHNPAFAGDGSPSLAASPLLPIEVILAIEEFGRTSLVLISPRHHRVRRRWFVPVDIGYQPRSVLIREVRIRPLEQHTQAIPESDEIRDVNE